MQLRLALLGAFAFPAPLGSQRFAAGQEQALREAGADVELLTHGAGDAWQRRLGPRRLAADRALAARLLAAHRVRPFDAVLAHNAEAALVALALRGSLRIPVLYVAHTLWAEELETWLPALPRRAARDAGAALDRRLARAADGVLALTETARGALARAARGPVACIPPGHAARPHPAPEAVEAACRAHGLAPDGFALYAGNLDRYQDLDVLDAAAAATLALPVVVATHDTRRMRLGRLRVLGGESIEAVRLLTYGAAVALLPRQRAGGFPIKLLSYMEAGRAIVAREHVAETLAHDESAWLVRDTAGPEDFARALRRLGADPALRTRLGAGAQRALEKHHAWPPLAEATLALVRAAIRRGAGR